MYNNIQLPVFDFKHDEDKKVYVSKDAKLKFYPKTKLVFIGGQLVGMGKFLADNLVVYTNMDHL